MNDRHIPVLLERCLDLLAPALAAPGAVVVDATLGLGGHAEALLARFDRIQLVGLDRDRHALALAGERLAPFADRIHLVHTVYDRLPDALDELGIARVAGILFDLGVSSMQLDEVDRGFSYAHDAPLDMRMDDTAELTAARVLAEYDEAELRRIFWEYGDEKLAPRYARRIVEERRTSPIESSARLVAIIDAATPRPRAARATSRSGCSRRSASRSTRSSRCWSARSRRRSTRSRSAAASWSWPTNRSRTAS